MRDIFLQIFKNACKNKQKIGTESEIFAYFSKNKDDQNKKEGIPYKRIPYKNENNVSIEKLLTEIHSKNDNSEKIYDKENLIAVDNKDYGSVSLEPGGQIEFASVQYDNLHEVKLFFDYQIQILSDLKKKFFVDFVFKGYDEFSNTEEISLIPKTRYLIMNKHMKNVGNPKGIGLEMMRKTCSVQFNFDYSDEEDMIKKVRVSTAIQPFLARIFSNSKFQCDKINKKANVKPISEIHDFYRKYIWQNLDLSRTGMPKFVFDEDFSFNKYIDNIIKIHPYFVEINDEYIPINNKSFEDIVNGNMLNRPLKESDAMNQLSFVFFETRLKPCIELRSFDSTDMETQLMLASFFVGILYDKENLNEIHNLIMNWSVDEIEKIYKERRPFSKNDKFEKNNILELILYMFDMSKKGLKRRGMNEEKYMQYQERLNKAIL